MRIIIDFIIENFNLIFGFIGSIFIAISVGRPKEMVQEIELDNGRRYHTAYLIHPFAFKLGLILFTISFIGQIIINIFI